MNTALLVIDIQRAAFDGAHLPPIASPERLVSNACALVEAAREGQVPIVFVQHSEGAGEAFEEGSPHWLLHESLVPTAGDVVLKKYASSSFESTDLHAQLKAKAIEHLVVCGLQSEFCVSNTTRSALQLGYTVQLAHDGHSTWPSKGQTAAEIEDEVNTRLAEAGAALAPTHTLAQALRHVHG